MIEIRARQHRRCHGGEPAFERSRRPLPRGRRAAVRFRGAVSRPDRCGPRTGELEPRREIRGDACPAPAPGKRPRGFEARGGGNSVSVPFYGCPECGWATIAPLSTALKAHRVGSPACAGELESIDDWRLPRGERERTVRRRRPARQDRAAAASKSARARARLGQQPERAGERTRCGSGRDSRYPQEGP